MNAGAHRQVVSGAPSRSQIVRDRALASSISFVAAFMSRRRGAGQLVDGDARAGARWAGVASVGLLAQLDARHVSHPHDGSAGVALHDVLEDSTLASRPCANTCR